MRGNMKNLMVIALLAPWIATSSARAADVTKTLVEGTLTAKAETIKAQALMVQARAALVTAFGQSGKAMAEARKVLEESRSVAIDNNMKAANTYFEKRKKREEYLATKARPQPSPGDLERYSKAAAPSRLEETVVNPVAYSARGDLQWPGVLEQPEFGPWRRQAEIAFAERSVSNSGPGSHLYQQMYRLTSRMEDELKEQVRDLPPMQYIAAKRFLESLTYETQFPPDSPRVAVR